jgi:hypothetical protein
MVEEIIGRLPELTGAQIARLEYELRHERRRRASAGGGEDAPHDEGAALPVTEVLKYRPYEDGYLHRHCCGSDRGDRLSRETYSLRKASAKEYEQCSDRVCSWYAKGE